MYQHITPMDMYNLKCTVKKDKLHFKKFPLYNIGLGPL